MQYACEILRVPRVTFFHLSTWYGRNALRHPSEHVTPWASAILEFQSTEVLIKSNRPFLLGRPDCRFTICTDASLKGWGAMVIDTQQHTFRVYGGSWKCTDAPIVELELLAVRNVIAAANLVATNQSLHVFCDNTAVCAILKSLNPRTFRLTVILRDIISLLPSSVFVPSYVPSESNPADPISRGCRVLSPALAARLREWGGVVEETGKP